MSLSKKILAAGVVSLALAAPEAQAQGFLDKMFGAKKEEVPAAADLNAKPVEAPVAAAPKEVVKPAAKVEQKALGTKVETKPEVKTDEKHTEKKTEVKTEEKKVDVKPETKAEEKKIEVKTEEKTTEIKSEEKKPEVKIEEKTEAQKAEEKKAEEARHGAPDYSKTLYGVAGETGSLKTFISLMEHAGLVARLKNPSNQTIFAPNDSAFEKLGSSTLENLKKPENMDKLNAILTYHIVNGTLDKKALEGKISAPNAAQGSVLNIDGTSGGIKVGTGEIVKSDIKGTNGLIHIIDRVQIPEGVMGEKK